MPKVYNRLQSSFVSLAWPWSGMSLTKGNQWECWDPRLGPNVVGLLVLLPPNFRPIQSLTGWYFVTWLVGWPIAVGKQAGWLTVYQIKCQPDPPCHQISDQPQAWQVDILSHGWLAGQLQLPSRLAGWLPIKPSRLAGWLPIKQNVKLTLPRQRHLVAMCVTTLVT